MQRAVSQAFRCAWAALAVLVLILGLGAADARAQLALGFQDDAFGPGATSNQSATAYNAVNAVNASFVRVSLGWAGVVPGGNQIPAQFDQADPADPHYNWANTDAAVRGAAQHHLNVIFVIAVAPTWAEGPGHRSRYVSPGAWYPNQDDFAAFVHAAAVRYGGSFPDPADPRIALPRVRYWEPWNEPNIPGFFSAPNPVGWYRALLNRAYGVLKAVHRDNVVVLGGLAPVSPVPGSIPPLDFGADLMCLRPVGSGFVTNRSCRTSAKFDVFGIHPYSLAATPTKHAYKQGDVLVGDMGNVAALVRAAERLHRSPPKTPIWATEFSWYTNPPNTLIGDSEKTAARYVAYSMYEMWNSGVSLVVWFQVLDISGNNPLNGGGVYSASGRPKLTLRALAFPLVAGVSRGRGFAWGRAPISESEPVVVERAVGRSWQSVARLRTGPDGIFYVRFSANRNGLYRARVIGGPTSLAYDSSPIPPRRTHVYSNF